LKQSAWLPNSGVLTYAALELMAQPALTMHQLWQLPGLEKRSLFPEHFTNQFWLGWFMQELSLSGFVQK
jgi:hypothetical protein